MEILIKVLQFLFSLSVLVFVHELGHFLMAKIFGIRVEKFYIFFNPWFSLFKFKKGETEYGMGWVPLGGYVKIAGMIDESMDLEQMKQPVQPWEFRSKPAWQRLLVMVGGVVVNFLFAFFLYSMILYTWGQAYLPAENAKYGIVVDSVMQDAGLRNGDFIVSLDNKKIDNFNDIFLSILLDDVKTVQVIRDGKAVEVVLPPTLKAALLSESSKGFGRKDFLEARDLVRLVEVVDDSPAQKAGLQKGDQILFLSGEPVYSRQAFMNAIASHRDQPMEIRLLRGADTLSYTVVAGEDGKIGVMHGSGLELAIREFTFWESIPAGFTMGVDRVKGYLKQFKLFKNPEAIKSLGGFIAIGNIFPSQWSWIEFWNLTAMLSLILGVMNLLPIPGLDGGHVLFLFYELVTRRKPSDKFMENAQVVGMVFVLLLLLVANGNDLIKLFS